jgi:hypothetical protein
MHTLLPVLTSCHHRREELDGVGELAVAAEPVDPHTQLGATFEVPGLQGTDLHVGGQLLIDSRTLPTQTRSGFWFVHPGIRQSAE